METPSLFRWIHLSDIHVGHGDAEHGWDQKAVMDVLLQDIAALVQSRHKPIDAVLVTGDIAFSGAGRSPTEYADAMHWLAAVGAAAGVEPSKRIFVVPGNHDVNRAADKDRSIKRLVDDLRSRRDKIDEALANRGEGGDRSLLAKRMEAYLGFSNGLAPASQRPEQSPAERLFWNDLLTTAQGLKVRLVGLNTALLAADDKDWSKLQLGKEQLRPLTRTEGELVMVLSHHPFVDGWLADQREADAWVRNHAHVHLSGHVHEADAEGSRKGSGDVFVRVVAGSVHGDQGAPAGHGYSFGEVLRGDDGKAKLRIWPRKWSPKRMGFVLDVENVQDGEQYSEHDLRLSLPAPAPAPTPVPAPVPTPVPAPAPAPGTTAGPVNVFISYCPEDEQLEKQLEKQLAQLRRQKKINIYHSQSFLAGEDQRLTIERYLTSAQVILVLLSADYLASEQGYDFELQTAHREYTNRGAHVVPILLRTISVSDVGPGDVEREWFTKLVQLPRNGQAVELWTHKDQAFATIADEIRKIVAPPQGTQTPMRPGR